MQINRSITKVTVCALALGLCASFSARADEPAEKPAAESVAAMDNPEDILGDWKLVLNFGGGDGEAMMTLTQEDEKLYAELRSQIGAWKSDKVEYKKTGDTTGTIRVMATIPVFGPDELTFEFIVDGDTIEGKEIGTDTTIVISGARMNAEEAAAYKEANTNTMITAAMVVQMLDKDKDGKISMEEAPEQLKQSFAMVDQDKDGGINEEEAAVVAMIMNSQAAAAAKPKPSDLESNESDTE